MFQRIAETYRSNVLGVGLGGATTNLYSIYRGRYLATLSANLGMSYSMYNVLREVGEENITRWLPFQIDGEELANRIHNKSMRPITLPQTLEGLYIEHALAREAIRRSLEEHLQLATPLKGVRPGARPLREGFEPHERESYIDIRNVDWICGTGGLLSHAPRRTQSALILMDSFQPRGITRLTQDSVFMMPHLGVLSTIHPKAALEIFEKDCLINLGTCITLEGDFLEGEKLGTIVYKAGEDVEMEVQRGSIYRIPTKNKLKLNIILERGAIILARYGGRFETTVEGGEAGIIIDARGRPLELPATTDERMGKISEWNNALQTYPITRFNEGEDA
jgi:hypothetical protein